MYNRLALFLSFLLISLNSFSVAIYLTILESPSGQLIFLIGEDHDRSNPYEGGNAKIIEAFINSVNKGAEDRNCSYHVLVEGIENPDYKSKDPDLLEGLLPLASKLSNTSVKNIEMREISSAANLILGHYNPLTLADDLKNIVHTRNRKFYDKKYGCKLDEITFKDVFEEFGKQSIKACEFRDHWAKEDNYWQKIFDLNIGRMYMAFVEAIVLLKKYNIVFDQKVMDVATDQFMRQIDEEEVFPEKTLRRMVLRNALRKTGAKLFDLFLYNRLANLRKDKTKHVVIIAGTGHTIAIEEDLTEESSYKEIATYTLQGKPLKAEMLKPLGTALSAMVRVKV